MHSSESPLVNTRLTGESEAHKKRDNICLSDETRRLGSRLKGAIWLLDSEPKRLLGPDARRSGRRHAARPRRTPEGSGPWPQTKKGPSRPLRAETPCMSGTAYPPTDCTAVLSAMGSLTAGFGMGPGDPPLHGSAHAGRSPARDECIPFSIQGPPWGLHGAQRTLFSLISDREDESR